ncbi:MAG TPA: MEKHLA domain-containing protein [Phenylobacterium sp.]|uniref:MEKHLA domain-containing protein n=1 Tax=Phenylobacterium sp. TaxID=1871053 RepID=UPI002B484BAA|nr:MEKHLA domain-containing protein [Phenylobacterium sp.]HKR90623.1 MEKHLA domain-containing protein [Phenylobacterium sp.]
MDAAEQLLTASAGARLALIAGSFARLTGRPLLGGTPASAHALWTAPMVILAHGTEPDPIFFYGDRQALELFELTAEQLLRTPSRLSAEAPERAERARLFGEVSRHGFIDNYAGVRISASGRRFRIEQACVWNLLDEAGEIHGQAAAFDHWVRLD